jgi:pimeloyl-ACP methyl ester carboxylesterase
VPQKYVRRDGLPLLLRHTGPTTLPEAPPFAGGATRVICLHDAGLQSSVFESLLRELETTSSSGLAFDLPGHGRSGSLDALPSIEDMAEMACWIADWCRIDRALLVGHGMGALVALEWARTRPDAVVGLILCGTGAALDIEDESIESVRQVTLGKAPRPFDPGRVCSDSGPELMRQAYMEGIKTDPRATLVDLEASRAWADAFLGQVDGDGDASGDPSPASIRCPVRVLSGSAEDPGSRTRASDLAARLGNASNQTVTSAAHFLPLEQPAALAAEISRFEGAAAS